VLERGALAVCRPQFQLRIAPRLEIDCHRVAPERHLQAAHERVPAAVERLRDPQERAQHPHGLPERSREVAVAFVFASWFGAPVVARGQGGLLDVTLDPRFSENRLIYLSYAEPGEGNLAGTAVARARLGEGRLEDVNVIYRQTPKVQGSNHFGSRIVFARDGTLFVTQGDRFGYREQAQDLSSGLGKIVRINPDGSAPKDNPFIGRKDARPEIWSYGHRNIQAAALDPQTGQLWTAEHGARGGDELNQPEAGKNYGWPVITYGIDYSGAKIGEGTAKPGMEQPVYYWDPVIAPSGMIFYGGTAFSDWKGSVFIGSLTPGLLVRLVLNAGKVTREERYLAELDERIREVQEGPDGLLYLLTDSRNGRVLRLRPDGPR